MKIKFLSDNLSENKKIRSIVNKNICSLTSHPNHEICIVDPNGILLLNKNHNIFTVLNFIEQQASKIITIS